VLVKIVVGERAKVDDQLGTVGNEAEVWQSELRRVLVARPDGTVPAAADAPAVTRSRTPAWLSGDRTQVGDSVDDAVRRGNSPLVDSYIGTVRHGIIGGSELETRDIVAGVVRVDLEQLAVDVLDSAGDVDFGSVGESLDLPDEVLNTVTGNGGFKAEGLWAREISAPSSDQGCQLCYLTRAAREAKSRMALRTIFLELICDRFGEI